MPDPSYDFIVVGAGAAGSVVASRLSESTARVLLLEAGDSGPPESALPGLFHILWAAGQNDWGYPSVSLPNMQQGYKNNRIKNYFQGKAVGGSTVINTLVYTRGAPQDYDSWASMGNPGWDYESVLPYFKKSEDFMGYETPLTDRYHGRGGLLTVEKKRYNPTMMWHLLQAGKGLGYGVVDSSLPKQIGFAPVQVTVRGGFRLSAAESFLRPVVDRTNLFIRPGAHVTKIIFNRRKRAVGVQFQFKGKLHTVKARKEVIVCAGAINSPKLLLLSGVGSTRHLRDVGVRQVAAVEGVGQNLREHIGIGFVPLTVNEKMSMSFSDPVGMFREFIANKTGLLAIPLVPSILGFAKLGAEGDKDWPDITFGIGAASLAADRGIFSKDTLGLDDEYFRALFAPVMKASPESSTFNVYLCRPESAGSVKLASRNHRDPPLIDFNFFDHPNDMKLLVKGIRLLFEIFNSRQLKEEVGARYVSEPVPGCRHLRHLSDGYWECFARKLVAPGWHPCGTSMMAPTSDPMGVVDRKLRLRGVSGVRVVDASIMPQVITANTMATAYMIGEKGAHMILQDWGYPTRPVQR